ncbi:DUF692 domain-containing protein [Microbulbifer taiwanensis]|uniref:UPF0276 protein ACFQBM_06750 n=1 Tax=Microbulbifer taiwanensis TaxID=986746 RepID=A0ABW1YJP5_9GAMM|nr:DUF692 domain-containing protein [Microbulbifer taiwanensis]
MPPNPETAAAQPARPFLGFGLGLRTPHFQQVLEQSLPVDWFEVVSENFMVAGGKPRYFLRAIGERYPLVMHGVSLSIGGTDPLDFDYLRQLQTLAEAVQPAWVSDHLCWTGVGGRNSHDLLPLPYAEEVVEHVAGRVRRVQDFLDRQILLENVSSYLTFSGQSMTEWEFYSEVCARADCLMLLDINNVYVSARNHGFEARDYIDHLDPRRVQQFHLAGHSDYGDYVIDTHDHDVPHPVWELYRRALRRFGAVSTLIERDDNIPELEEMVTELEFARRIYTDESAAETDCAP